MNKTLTLKLTSFLTIMKSNLFLCSSHSDQQPGDMNESSEPFYRDIKNSYSNTTSHNAPLLRWNANMSRSRFHSNRSSRKLAEPCVEGCRWRKRRKMMKRLVLINQWPYSGFNSPKWCPAQSLHYRNLQFLAPPHPLKHLHDPERVWMNTHTVNVFLAQAAAKPCIHFILPEFFCLPLNSNSYSFACC